MPKFDAGSIGGKIEYDFTEWGGPTGVVPEPSRFAVKKFMKETQQVFKNLGLKEDNDESEDDESETMSPNELVDTMNAVEDEQLFDDLTDGITDCLAEVCGAKRTEKETGERNAEGFPVVEVTYEGGSPSHAVLSALDYRPFMGFFGYLMENLMNPEASRSDTKRSPRRLRSV